MEGNSDHFFFISIEDFPNELLERIVHFLDDKSFVAFYQVSKRFYHLFAGELFNRIKRLKCAFQPGRCFFVKQRQAYVWEYADLDSNRVRPQCVLRLPEDGVFIDVIASEKSVFLLTRAGKVYAAGDNCYGQLGIDEPTLYQSTPLLVQLPEDLSVVDVFAFWDRTFFKVEKMGEYAGIYACGTNEYGQLGINNMDCQIQLIPAWIDFGVGQVAVTRIFSGLDNSFFVTVSDETEGDAVYAAGNNIYGQLGVKTDRRLNYTFPSSCREYFSPRQVHLADRPFRVLTIFLHDMVSFFVTESCQDQSVIVYGAGYNDISCLGVGEHYYYCGVPETVKLPPTVKAVPNIFIFISKCTRHFLNASVFFVVNAFDQKMGVNRLFVYAAGSNLPCEEDIKFSHGRLRAVHGQLGVGSSRVCRHAVPTEVMFAENMETVVAIQVFSSVGRTFFVLQKRDAVLNQEKTVIYGCGANQLGVLGVGHRDDLTVPVKVQLSLEGEILVNKIFIFLNKTFFLIEHLDRAFDEERLCVYACGLNNYGQLGIGEAWSGDYQYTPEKVILPESRLNIQIFSFLLVTVFLVGPCDRPWRVFLYACGVKHDTEDSFLYHLGLKDHIKEPIECTSALIPVNLDLPNQLSESASHQVLLGLDYAETMDAFYLVAESLDRSCLYFYNCNAKEGNIMGSFAKWCRQQPLDRGYLIYDLLTTRKFFQDHDCLQKNEEQKVMFDPLITLQAQSSGLEKGYFRFYSYQFFSRFQTASDRSDALFTFFPRFGTLSG